MTTPRPAACTIAVAGTALAWGLYVATASGGVGWYDAPELAAAAQQLGVAHSPGEPAYILLLKLAQMVPLGDLASRAVWVSAFGAAAVVGLSVLLARELLPPPCVTPVGLVAVAALVATSGAVWAQGVVVELYGFQAAISLGSLLAVARSRGRPGPLALAGLLAGLGVAINPLLTILIVPAALVLALAQRPRPPRSALAGVVVFGLFGLSAFVYLPLRSAAAPGVWFAELDSVGDVAWFISGRPYARSFPAPSASLVLTNLGIHAHLLVQWLGVPALLAAAIGVLALARRPWVAVALGWLGLGTWLTTVTRPLVETHTPDVAGYLVPSVVVVALLAAAGIALLATRLPVAGWALLAVTVATCSWGGAHKADEFRAHPAEAVASSLLASVPAGGVLLAGSDSTALPVMYATSAGRRRPDVLALGVYAVGRAQMTELARRHPHVSVTPLALVDGLVPEERIRALVAPNLERGVVGTPLIWPPELMDELAPCGLALLAGGPRVAARPGGADDRLRAELVEPLWDARRLARDRQLRRLLVSSTAAQVHVLLRQGRTEVAHARLRHASALHPDPWSYVHLQRASMDDGTLAPPIHRPPESTAGLGRAALELGDTVLARGLLARAVEEYPADADLWEDLALCRFWERDLKGASEAWNEALRLRPGSPGALTGLERLYSLGEM